MTPPMAIEPRTQAAPLRHLLSIAELSSPQLRDILSSARAFSDVNTRARKKVPALRGLTVVTFFFENSTRTKLSFEVAAKRLSADTLSFSGASSSLSKGESFLDTARVLESWNPDILILRHSQPGAAHLLTTVTDAAVVNAGDGPREHPTQALLDAFTLLEHFAKQQAKEQLPDEAVGAAERQTLAWEDGLRGKTVTIVGDIAHSRVARSNLACLTKLGARVRVCGPATLLPVGLAEEYACEVFTDVDKALARTDAVMMLRIQKERMAGPLLASDREYAALYGMTTERAARLGPAVPILHPGPINRGVEIAPDVADSARSLILEQTKNSVAVRMAVLYLLARGRGAAEAVA